MQNVLAILQHVPWWVFAVFALLIWLGVQALSARAVPIWRLLVTPAVFIGWGVVSLVLRSTAAPLLIADWAVTAAIGAAIAWATAGLDDAQIDRTRGVVRLPGSKLPLLRNLAIFSAKFGLAVAMALAPTWHGTLTGWDIAVSGASAGYFLGWLARLALAYRQKPETILG